MQDYPQEKIEIVIAYCGSSKDVVFLKKKYAVKVVFVAKNKQNAEYNRGVAFKNASNNLVFVIDDDNFLPDKNIISQMVNALMKHKEALAAESCWYYYDKDSSILDRYFSLFGILDPIAYYLGKADRMRQDSQKWNLLGKGIDMGNYYLVDFEKNPRKISTIGANGCLIKKNYLTQNSDTRPEYYYHTDVLLDAFLNGYSKMVFIKNSIAHYTGSRGAFNFLKRRFIYMLQFSLMDHKKRRFRVFMSGDELILIKSIIICSTFIIPFYDSFRGFIKIHDIAWFLHPFFSFSFVVIYSMAVLLSIIKKTVDFVAKL